MTMFIITNNYRLSLIPVIIYIFLPFSFFFDRLALPDNLLSLFGVLSLLFTLLLSKYPRFDLSMILGFILGLSWLTKSPAIYFIVLSSLTFFILAKKIAPPTNGYSIRCAGLGASKFSCISTRN